MTVSNEMSACKKGLNSINFHVNNRHSGLKSCIYITNKDLVETKKLKLKLKINKAKKYKINEPLKQSKGMITHVFSIHRLFIVLID